MRPSRIGRDADRLLVMIAYLCGLGYANHMAGMLPAPAVALAVIVRRPSTIAALAAAAGVRRRAGRRPHAVRDAADSRRAFPGAQRRRADGLPNTSSSCPARCRRARIDAFMYNFNRGQYGKPALSDRQASFGEQVGMWWLYFKWQWLRDRGRCGIRSPRRCWRRAFFVLGLLGGWMHYQRDRRTFWYFGSLMFTMTLLLIYYLNFKLGASQDPASPAPHEVRDRDYFFLWSFSAWGVWAALGFDACLGMTATLFGTEKRRIARDVIGQPTTPSWMLTSPMLLLAVVPLAGNWTVGVSRARTMQHATSPPICSTPSSRTACSSPSATTTRFRSGTRRKWKACGATSSSPTRRCSNTDWYARQIIRRPIYDYDAAARPRRLSRPALAEACDAAAAHHILPTSTRPGLLRSATTDAVRSRTVCMSPSIRDVWSSAC